MGGDSKINMAKDSRWTRKGDKDGGMTMEGDVESTGTGKREIASQFIRTTIQ